jgi:hypothetical protein
MFLGLRATVAWAPGLPAIQPRRRSSAGKPRAYGARSTRNADIANKKPGGWAVEVHSWLNRVRKLLAREGTLQLSSLAPNSLAAVTTAFGKVPLGVKVIDG